MEEKVLVREIQLSLDAKDYESAAGLLEQASKLWPASIWIELLRGCLIERTGSSIQACSHYRHLLNEHPRGFRVAPRLVNVLVQAGEIAKGREVLCEFIVSERQFDDNLKRQLLNAVTPLNGRPDETVDFLEELVLQGDLESWRLIRLSEFYALCGRHEDSLRACVNADALGVSAERSQVIKLRSLFNLGRFKEAHDLARRLFDVYPLNREVGFLLATLSKLGGASDEIVNLYDVLLSRFPRDGKLLAIIGSSPFKEADFERLYSHATENRRKGFYSNHSLLEYAYLCLRAGCIDDSNQVLAEISASQGALKDADVCLSALGRWPFNACRERTRIPFSPSDHVVVVQASEPKATVFCFSTFFNRINGLPSAFTDAILADFPVNVVYLSDPSYRLGLEGFEGLGSSAIKTAERLRALASCLGGERIFTLGSSSGGFTAILYGALMEAEAVISFAGQSTLMPDGSEFRGLENRKSVLSLLTKANTDLRSTIEASERTRFICYYGDSWAPDVYQAKRLDGLANAHTIAVRNCADHKVGLHMAARGELVPALESALSLVS